MDEEEEEELGHDRVLVTSLPPLFFILILMSTTLSLADMIVNGKWLLFFLSSLFFSFSPSSSPSS